MYTGELGSAHSTGGVQALAQACDTYDARRVGETHPEKTWMCHGKDSARETHPERHGKDTANTAPTHGKALQNMAKTGNDMSKTWQRIGQSHGRHGKHMAKTLPGHAQDMANAWQAKTWQLDGKHGKHTTTPQDMAKDGSVMAKDGAKTWHRRDTHTWQRQTGRDMAKT